MVYSASSLIDFLTTSKHNVLDFIPLYLLKMFLNNFKVYLTKTTIQPFIHSQHFSTLGLAKYKWNRAQMQGFRQS